MSTSPLRLEPRLHGFAPIPGPPGLPPRFAVQVCRCCSTIISADSPSCPNCMDAGASLPVAVADHVWTPEPGPLPGQEACVYCWHHEDEHQCPGDLITGSLSAAALGVALSGVN